MRKIRNDKERTELEEKKRTVFKRRKGKKQEDRKIFCDNRLSPVLLFKCRTGTLNFNDRKRFAEETENLEHFLLWCPEYQRERSENKKLQRPFKEEVEEVMGELLFEEDIEEAKETSHKM